MGYTWKHGWETWIVYKMLKTAIERSFFYLYCRLNMKRMKNFRWLACWVLVAVAISCGKELSFETGTLGAEADAILVDDASTGNCTGIQVRGRYRQGVALGDTNFLQVRVNFRTPGRYKIYSDTVNGFWFRDSGFVSATGERNIQVIGRGTPAIGGVTANFVLELNNSVCFFSVPVLTGTGITPPPPSPLLNYLPTTTNSTWVYEYLPTIAGLDSVRQRNTGLTLTVSGNTFFKYATTYFTTPPVIDTFFYSKDNTGNYFTISTPDFDFYPLFDSAGSLVQYPYLRSEVAAGTNWLTDSIGVKIGNDVGFARARLTVFQKGQTRAVLGTTYTNVIQMKREILFRRNNQTTFQVVEEGDSFYAPNVGLIDQSIITGPSSIQSISLRRSLIVP